MKSALLFICIALIFSLVHSEIIVNNRLSRTIGPETPSLQIEFRGTCEEFRDRVLGNIRISSYRDCLPIQLFPAHPEIDDLGAHYFCTNKPRARSVHHFVEIFANTTDDNNVSRDFILSLTPSAPFRVLTKGTTLSRRPDCVTTEDYCNGANPIVSGCTTNNVAIKDGWALNNDRIYITSNQKVVNDCKNNSVCCNYITASDFGGLCPHHSNEELLALSDYKEEHKEKPQKPHRPQVSGYGDRDGGRPRPGQGRPGLGRPGQGRPGKDEEEDDKKRVVEVKSEVEEKKVEEKSEVEEKKPELSKPEQKKPELKKEEDEEEEEE